MILWDTDPLTIDRLRIALGADTPQVESAASLARALEDNHMISQVVIGPGVDLDQACQLAEATRIDRPELGVILVRSRVDIGVLGQALRSGVREVIAAEDQTALADAIRRSRELTAKLVSHAGGGSGREGRVVTVFSAKGGVGKTTLSTNLAAYLAISGLKTLLIDLDLSFGDVGISLQLRPAGTVMDAVAMSGHLDEQGLASMVTHHADSGLDVICAPGDPSDGDRVPVNTVVELLRVARTHYDYVIVDTPPSFTEHVLAACDVSTRLVLIATLDIPAVKNLRLALDTLDMLGNPRESRTIVLNRSDAKVGLKPEDVVAAIKMPIAANVPNSASVPASINRGVPIVLDEARHPVSIAIREIADQHLRGKSPTGADHEPKRGFGLLRSRR